MSDKSDHPVLHAIATGTTLVGLGISIALEGANINVADAISALPQCQQVQSVVTNQLPPSTLQQVEGTLSWENNQSEQGDQMDAVQAAKEEEEKRAG